MDNRSGHQAAQNGPPSLPDISKSTLSATAPIFIPRSYQPPPPPENEVRHEGPPHYQVNQGFVQQPPEYEDFNQGGHRGGFGGGGGGYYNNRGNYRGHRGRGRGHRGGGGRGGYRGNYHNNYHGGQHHGGGGGHHGGQHGRHPGGQFPNAPHDALEQVKQAIAVMTDNPEMFDEIMQPLTASLATIVRSDTELRNIVEELMTQSVRETNFRYIGAKMCNFFSQNLQVSIPNGGFRSHLLSRLQEEQNKRDQVLESPRSSEHLIGFTLFMGELLVNPTSDPEFQRLVDIWTVAIEELVETLLAAGHDNCLRAVVQVLKLTGSQLDASDKARHPSGRPERVDTIFDKIKAVIEEDRMQSPSARSMKVYLQSVVDLRTTEWGQKETDGRPKQINPYLNMQVPTPIAEVRIMQPDAGVMFDENGMPNFQMWSNGSDFGGVEQSDNQPDVYWSPAEEEEYYAYMMSEEEQGPFQEEMDDEIADAFEEFMRENDARQSNAQPQQ